MHWLGILLFWPDTQNRTEIDDFIETGASTAFVKRMRARCRFTLTTDRLVEQLHAYSKHFLDSAPYAGAVHIAFFSAVQAIRAALEKAPEGGDSFKH